jgi:hypothetical protein
VKSPPICRRSRNESANPRECAMKHSSDSHRFWVEKNLTGKSTRLRAIRLFSLVLMKSRKKAKKLRFCSLKKQRAGCMTTARRGHCGCGCQQHPFILQILQPSLVSEVILKSCPRNLLTLFSSEMIHRPERILTIEKPDGWDTFPPVGPTFLSI